MASDSCIVDDPIAVANGFFAARGVSKLKSKSAGTPHFPSQTHVNSGCLRGHHVRSLALKNGCLHNMRSPTFGAGSSTRVITSTMASPVCENNR